MEFRKGFMKETAHWTSNDSAAWRGGGGVLEGVNFREAGVFLKDRHVSSDFMRLHP